MSSINDSDDPFERMLAVLRFTFSKDLKFIVRISFIFIPVNSLFGFRVICLARV